MHKQFLILIAAGFLWMNKSTAQNIGILPLTGIRYFKGGIWAKSIDVKMDGAVFYSNRLPLNKEIEISLLQPTGFTPDKNKTVFAAAEFSLLSEKGDLLLQNPNLLLLNETKGFAAKDFKTLSMKFGVNESLMKANSNGMIRIRLYDLKGKNQLKLEFPVSFARPGEAIQVTKLIKTVKSPAGSVCMISGGLKAGNVYVKVDTSIKSYPKNAYSSLEIVNIEGTSLGGIFEGKEKFWVYDQNLNEIKVSDILLKEVGGALEDNIVNYTLKVPFRLKVAPAKGYIVRFRWESADRSKVIDVVVNI